MPPNEGIAVPNAEPCDAGAEELAALNGAAAELATPNGAAAVLAAPNGAGAVLAAPNGAAALDAPNDAAAELAAPNNAAAVLAAPNAAAAEFAKPNKPPATLPIPKGAGEAVAADAAGLVGAVVGAVEVAPNNFSWRSFAAFIWGEKHTPHMAIGQHTPHTAIGKMLANTHAHAHRHLHITTSRPPLHAFPPPAYHSSTRYRWL